MDESDEILIEKALRGDMRACDILLEQYRPRIHYICGRFLGNREDAEDVTQEALGRAAKNLDKFRGSSSFFTWLYRIAKHACVDKIHKKRGITTVPIERDPDIPDKRDFEREITEKDYRQDLLSEIGKHAKIAKPPWDKLDNDIYLLHFLKDVKYIRNVAKMLGENENKVKYRLYKRIIPVIKAAEIKCKKI